MPKRFLNVEYSGIRTRIDVTEAERVGQVQMAVKEALSIGFGYGLIEIYDQQGQHIKDLDDISEDYYKKAKDRGLFLVVHTLQPNQQKTSNASVSIPSKCNLRQSS